VQQHMSDYTTTHTTALTFSRQL